MQLDEPLDGAPADACARRPLVLAGLREPGVSGPSVYRCPRRNDGMIIASWRARSLSERQPSRWHRPEWLQRRRSRSGQAPGPVMAMARASIPLLPVAIMLFSFTMARRRLPGGAVLVVEPGDEAQGVVPLAGDALVDCPLVVARQE